MATEASVFEEASSRRYEAGGWLRKMVGVVVGKDLPAHPSEDEFRLGLRSGIILCKVLNKVKPYSVPKIVEAPGDSILIPDGEALSSYQYFENVRNFLVSVKEMELPTFEISDLEKGGRSSRLVNCVLALKSYKETGGSVPYQSPGSSPKHFERKISDLVTRSLSRSSLSRENSVDTLSSIGFASGYTGHRDSDSWSTIVQDLLEDNEQEDIPIIVENFLSKVTDEFEYRLALQKEQAEQAFTLLKEQQECYTSHQNHNLPDTNMDGVLQKTDVDMDGVLQKTDLVNDESSTYEERESIGVRCNCENDIQNTQMKCQSVRQQMLVERHQRDIQELKNLLNAAKTDMHLLKTSYEEEVVNLGKQLNGITHAASGYEESLELKELKEQNANLKAALAREEGKMGHSPYSSSPELLRRKSFVSFSPSHASFQSSGGLTGRTRRQSMDGTQNFEVSINSSDKTRRQSFDGLSGLRKSMDGTDNIEVRSNSTDIPRRQSYDGLIDRRQSRGGSESIQVRGNSSEKERRQSLDLDDLLSWPAIGNPLPSKRGVHNDLVPGDWVEKVMVNKGDPKSGAKPQGRWGNETGKPPNIFKANSTPNLPNKYPLKSTNKVSNYSGGSNIATTSDSFEDGFPEQTKAKKSIAKQSKSQDKRSSIPARPGRRVTNGTNSSRRKTSTSK